MQLRHTELRAVTGIVISRNVEPGEVVTPSQEVLTLSDLSRVDLKIYVGETEIGKIRPGQAVDVKIDTFPDKAYPGTGGLHLARRPSSHPRSSRPTRSGSSSSTW